MASLLHLDSSAHRSTESVTRRLTATFAAAWRAVHGDGGYTYRDLAADPVPPLDTAYCALGRRVERRGVVGTAGVPALIDGAAEHRAWQLTRPLIAELTTADTVLIGAPMYNYSVPAALKAWIDRVTFPGAFLDPDTADSVLRGTSVVLVAARGGAYGPDTPRHACDHQVPYLRAYFGRHGVPDANIHVATAELTLAELVDHLAPLRPLAARSLRQAQADVDALARAATRSRMVAAPSKTLR